MARFHRDKIFSGSLDNEDVEMLFEELKVIEQQAYLKREEITKLQDECDHDFHMYCEGAYDDTFYCKHCYKKATN